MRMPVPKVVLPPVNCVMLSLMSIMYQPSGQGRVREVLDLKLLWACEPPIKKRIQ